MPADRLGSVVGVDPHRDSHALAVVEVRSGAVVFEANVAANSDGYRQALALGQEQAPGRRVFAVEGTGSFGAGLTRFLTGRGERVLEVGRLRREGRSGGKTDALDAVRTGDVRTRSRPCAQTACLRGVRPSERTPANPSERRTLPSLPRVARDHDALASDERLLRRDRLLGGPSARPSSLSTRLA
jgi:transposase